MMKKSLEYISNAVGGVLSPSTSKDRIVDGFYSDSRVPEKDKLFLALKGERVDGNSFVPALLEQGFCAITDNKENLSLNGDCIYVNDVRDALQILARFYRITELANMPFVGITGSVGKTTTKDMVALALSSSLDVHKTAGNFNSQIGLPQTVLATPVDVDCAVVELGMSYPGEMERISRCACPDISMITNIGYSHIENLGSREAIRDEKLKIASYSQKDSVMILNGDEPLLRNAKIDNAKLCFVSLCDDTCDCYAENIVESLSGITFTANIFGGKYDVSLSVCGKHFVINALFALATAKLMGIDVSCAVNKLSEYKSDGKRQFVYENNGHTVISDCYNASPESMRAALSVLASSKGRRIAVLGDMLELGEESLRLHKLVGEYVTDSADVLITYGDHSKNIAETAKVSEKYSFTKEEFSNFKDFLMSYIKNGDVVLYKASNGMKLSDFIV